MATAYTSVGHFPEAYLEVVGQAYAGMMAMHEEIKRVYKERLQEKEERIAELTQDLVQAKQGVWRWLFGRGAR